MKVFNAAIEVPDFVFRSHGIVAAVVACRCVREARKIVCTE